MVLKQRKALGVLAVLVSVAAWATCWAAPTYTCSLEGFTRVHNGFGFFAAAEAIELIWATLLLRGLWRAFLRREPSKPFEMVAAPFVALSWLAILLYEFESLMVGRWPPWMTMDQCLSTWHGWY